MQVLKSPGNDNRCGVMTSAVKKGRLSCRRTDAARGHCILVLDKTLDSEDLRDHRSNVCNLGSYKMKA